jgi:flagellar basal body P-ring formation protein FlgA
MLNNSGKIAINKPATPFSQRKRLTKPSIFQRLRFPCSFLSMVGGILTRDDKRRGPHASQGVLKTLVGFGLICVCAVQMTTWADAREIQSIKSIRDTVTEFLKASIYKSHPSASRINENSTINVDKLDPRLTLDHCQVPLQAFLPAGTHLYGKTTVGVRCDGHKPWTVYVPANIVTLGKYLVAKRSLRRGQILRLADVEYAEKDTSALPGNHITDTDDIIGMELKHHLSPGRAVTADMLTQPDTIKKGQQVTIYSQSGGLLVSSVGIAMTNGAEGGRVKVKNPNSRRVIEGIVRADGTVETSR